MTSSDYQSAPTERPSGASLAVCKHVDVSQEASLRQYSSGRRLDDRDISGSRFIVVMGVSGTGKSTLGAALAERLHLPFIDGDDLHPATNIAKMARGEPLGDVDRQPWLETIRETAITNVLTQVGVRNGDGYGERETRSASSLAERDDDMAWTSQTEGARIATGTEPGVAWQPGVVVACSALKKAYREVLRGPSGLSTYFVYIQGDRAVLMVRMTRREGHFMKASMLASQLDTLESPEGEEGVVTVSAEMSTAEQVQRVVEMLGR